MYAINAGEDRSNHYNVNKYSCKREGDFFPDRINCSSIVDNIIIEKIQYNVRYCINRRK